MSMTLSIISATSAAGDRLLCKRRFCSRRADRPPDCRRQRRPRGTGAGELFPETTIARTTRSIRSSRALGLFRPERSSSESPWRAAQKVSVTTSTSMQNGVTTATNRSAPPRFFAPCATWCLCRFDCSCRGLVLRADIANQTSSPLFWRVVRKPDILLSPTSVFTIYRLTP